MTPQPAPGAAVVQRDARTIPRGERRDGRRIATPTSDEVPEFRGSVRNRGLKARGRAGTVGLSRLEEVAPWKRSS
jgi:hypothetical protein